MLRKLTWLLCIGGAICASGVLANQTAPEERPVAPYFHVEGSDDATDRLPLKSTGAKVNIVGVIAHVKITQTYANLGNEPINARYIFPGSTSAAVTSMTMTIGDRVIRARIKEKEEAKAEFKAAQQAGKSASLLQQQRPNVFSTDVANIMPGDTIEVELGYTELLEPDKGVYEFVYPAVVGPRYGGREAADDPGQHWIANPYLEEGRSDPVGFAFELNITTPMPLQELKSATHRIDTQWRDETSATVAIAAGETNPANRDFILQYRLQQGEIVSGLLRYAGEQENYFLLMAEPPERVRPEHIPAREYIFVVDVSGSMSGFPLDVSKAMLKQLIDRLRPTDTFNLLFFSGSSWLFSPQSLPANGGNLERALRALDSQRGGGGTELLSAMSRALELPKQEDSARSIVILTDGYIAAERTVFAQIRNSLGDTNVFAFGIGSSVNRYLIEGIAKSGNGAMFVLTDAREAERLSREFIDYIEAPILTGIRVAGEDVELYDVEPGAMPDMLGQRAVLAYGKYRTTGVNPRIVLSGVSGSGAYERSFAFAAGDEINENEALQWLWARKRIGSLSDFYFGDPERNRAEILALGLQYSLLTRYTSFVAVDETVRNRGGAAKNVKQPLPLPAGVSNSAVRGTRNVSEPPLFLLFGILLSGLLLRRLVILNKARG